MQTHFLIWWCLCCVHATNDKRQPANDTSYMVLWVPERLATQSYTSAKDVHMTTSILLKNIQTFCTFLCLAWITCSSVWLVHLYPPHRDLIFRIYKSKPSASIHYIRRYIYIILLMIEIVWTWTWWWQRERDNYHHLPYIHRHKCRSQSFESARIHLVDSFEIYPSSANSLHLLLMLNYDVPMPCFFCF